MLIEVSNTLTVENPTPEMVLWCKRNLTIPNPDYAKKSRMNLWLGNTPKVLSLYETRGTTLVLPFGTLRLLPKDISDKALFLSEFAAPVEVNYNADVPLYDYQEIAVQAMVAAKYGILQSAAGSGKTQMGIALAARLGRRTLLMQRCCARFLQPLCVRLSTRSIRTGWAISSVPVPIRKWRVSMLESSAHSVSPLLWSMVSLLTTL